MTEHAHGILDTPQSASEHMAMYFLSAGGDTVWNLLLQPLEQWHTKFLMAPLMVMILCHIWRMILYVYCFFDNHNALQLPVMNPFPAPRSVILLDNCSIHHVDGVQELCDQHGVILEFLPPYSPECAPVEMVFNLVKKWIQKKRDWIAGLDDSDEIGFTILHMAIAECVDFELGESLFRHANIF